MVVRRWCRYSVGQVSFKLGPALLAGNTVVLKPSAFTPLANLRLGEVWRDLLPAGVVNVVAGSGGLGEWVTEHPGFDKISFTGSTQTGRKVMASAAQRLARVTLELGGNDAAIVLPDVDVKEVAPQLFWAAFANSGQICLATKRLYVHEDVYDDLARELVRLAEQARVGDPSEGDVDLGPVSNQRQYETVVSLLRDCRDHGYRFLAGGLPEDGDGGCFVAQTLVDNPPESSRIVREEQFGPVLPLLKYRDVDDAVKRANAGEYALGASVWAGDPEAGQEVAARLETGTVWVNEVMQLDPLVPFGGRAGVTVPRGRGARAVTAGALACTGRMFPSLGANRLRARARGFGARLRGAASGRGFGARLRGAASGRGFGARLRGAASGPDNDGMATVPPRHGVGRAGRGWVPDPHAGAAFCGHDAAASMDTGTRAATATEDKRRTSDGTRSGDHHPVPRARVHGAGLRGCEQGHRRLPGREARLPVAGNRGLRGRLGDRHRGVGHAGAGAIRRGGHHDRDERIPGARHHRPRHRRLACGGRRARDLTS
ncbi:aldehyde dehydrogenase family protein [Streptomyces sp. NPDC058451]|uniref:aldehyde dehydrogenase family protein n=1 Tax=Streptomyces sp. NPDC058451 TaxID=3346506 RepID=UPI0036632F9A